MNAPVQACPARNRERGMTLLEIMLAMLVMTMVVSMVSLSLSGSVRVVGATTDQGEIYYRARVALQRISEDISSALLIDGVEFIGEDGDINGNPADVLGFPSMAHIVFDPDNDHPGVAYLAYTVVADEDNEGELLLLRSDIPLATADIAGLSAPDLEDQGFLLSDRLRSVDFLYIDEEGNEHESWTTVPEPGVGAEERKLPVAVRCVLEYWLDREQEISTIFSTSVLLPVGLIHAKKK